MRDMLLLGTSQPDATPWSAHVVRHFMRAEPDPRWRATLEARSAWAAFMLRRAQELGPVTASERAEMAELYGREVTDADLERTARIIFPATAELLGPLGVLGMNMLRAAGGPAAATNLRIESNAYPNA
jgi:hypothetical protein